MPIRSDVRRATDAASRDAMHTFRRAALFTMAAVVVMNVMLWVLQPDQRSRVLVSFVAVNGVGLAGLVINHGGRARLASAIFVFGLIAQASVLSLTGGGIRSPGVTMNFVFVLMAGVLLGKRWGYVAAAVCAAIGLVLVGMEHLGRVPVTTVPFGPMPHWVLNMVYMVVTLVLVGLATDQLGAALRRAEDELKQRTAAEAKRERVLMEVGERVKELRLLHAAAQLLGDRPYKPAVLHELVRHIPGAWQHSPFCVARITCGDAVAESPGWRETPWQMTARFATTSGTQGAVDVAYTTEYPAADEGPFLREERDVLDSLAEMLRAYVDRHEAERRRIATEHQLRQSQKMEALGTLAGGIAHDFNNILTAILGNAQIAKLDVDSSSPVHASLTEIENAGGRAADLVRRILLFSRREESARRSVALGPVMTEAVSLLRVAAPKSVRIESHVVPDLPPVIGDASQLYQVILNLGTNGIHAMQAQGGTLHLRLDAMSVEANDARFQAALLPGQHVRLTVTDDGTGMSEEIRTRLFEPFFTTKGHEGTGLGLSVAHGIVQEHGGTITAESEVGHGTTMRVYLPAAEPDLAADAPVTAIPHGIGQHIMYVDDEEALVHMTRLMLERLGYRCTGHTDPHAALAQFREVPGAFAAVITDFAMPRMTGLELARELRAIRRDIPVALTSGNSPREAFVPGEVALHIRKPSPMADFAIAVARLVDRRDGPPAAGGS